MVNYGYGPDTKGWNSSKVDDLARKLANILWNHQHGTDLPSSHIIRDNNNLRDGLPYVEVDGLYQGVRIRRLTNLPDEEVKQIVAEADKAYEEIMGGN